jgi:hypothetical protein
MGLFFLRVEPSEESTLAERFQKAVDKAMLVDDEDIVDTLWPLIPGDEKTIWDAEAKRVLMATWTDYTGYDGYVSKSLPLKKEVWVSPVPQLLNQCRGFGLSGDDLALRLRQYLGLTPTGNQDRVVELWVRPEDLFRPCADDEISDRECRLGMPDTPVAPVEKDTPGDAGVEETKQDPQGASRQRDGADHAEWFRQRVLAYFEPGAYPWTRLGYTFDWGDSMNHVGASEYVIRPSAVVWVNSVSKTESYCTPNMPIPKRMSPPKD